VIPVARCEQGGKVAVSPVQVERRDIMSFNPTRFRAAGTLLTALLLAGGTTVMAQEARRMHLGIRGGGNFEYEDAAVGASLTVPLGRYFDLYPSFDAYFPDEGSRFGFNADLKYRIPTRTAVKFYSGAGLGMIRREVFDDDDHQWGANVLGGIEHQAGWVHPFLETRVMFYDQTSVGLTAGVNLTLGGSRRR
jgi:hypothetical protein